MRQQFSCLKMLLKNNESRFRNDNCNCKSFKFRGLPTGRGGVGGCLTTKTFCQLTNSFLDGKFKIDAQKNYKGIFSVSLESLRK